MNTPFEINREEVRARVEAAPWSFFHFPVEFWTTELALIAWRHIGFVLARVPSDFLPELYFEDGKWEQFLELLCGTPLVAALATSGTTHTWPSAVSCINDHLAYKSSDDGEEQLPHFADL